MSPKPTDIVPIKLRMREALRRKLEREAEKKKISANAEAIQRARVELRGRRRAREARKMAQGATGRDS